MEVYFPNVIKITVRNDKSWLLEALDNYSVSAQFYKYLLEWSFWDVIQLCYIVSGDFFLEFLQIKFDHVCFH